jgi:hypothetical protein
MLLLSIAVGIQVGLFVLASTRALGHLEWKGDAE